MGQRGNITSPTSVRGIRAGLSTTTDTPEAPKAPSWLSKEAKKEFRSLVASLVLAGVPIKQVDSAAIANASSCIASIAQWTVLESTAPNLTQKIECSKLVARYQRDSQQWLASICATPTSRARLGLKAPVKETGPLAKLLEQKKLNAA